MRDSPDRAFQNGPGRSSRGTKAADQRGEQSAPLLRAEERGLNHGGVERSELKLEARRTGLGSVAGRGQGKAGCSLHRPIGEDNRIPAKLTGGQVERSLGDFDGVDEVIGLPGGIAQGDGSGEAVGRGCGRSVAAAGERSPNESVCTGSVLTGSSQGRWRSGPRRRSRRQARPGSGISDAG